MIKKLFGVLSVFFLFFVLCLLVRGVYSYAVSAFLEIPASLQLNVHFPFALTASIASAVASISVEKHIFKQFVFMLFSSLVAVVIHLFLVDLKRSAPLTPEYLVMNFSPWVLSLGIASAVVGYINFRVNSK